MKKEIWKDIKGYEGKYQISNFGRVKSLPRNGTINKERILKTKLTKFGYERVYLRNKNTRTWFLIHRLVAMYFIPNPDNLPQVNHKDECKTNNHVENLEWCDGFYNQSYGTVNIRRVATRRKNLLK